MSLFKRFLAAALFFLLVASPGCAEGAERRFEELAARYAFRMESRSEANDLRGILEGEAAEIPPVELWRSLFAEGTTPRRGAANALALLRMLLEDGDPARWDEVAGFVHPARLPKPLMAADALYAAALHLLDVEERGAEALAGMLIERLMESPRGKHLFISTAPAEYPDLVRRMTEKGVSTSFGRWPDGEVEGALPFAAPVRGRVSRERALRESMTFLNAAGQPVSNGMYAWDRKKGEIYTVVEFILIRRWRDD